MHTSENKSFVPKENTKIAEKIKRILYHMKYKEGSMAFAVCTKMLRALDMNPDVVYDAHDPEKWLSELQKKGIINPKEYDICLDIVTSEIQFEKPTKIETTVSGSEHNSKDETMWNDAWYEAVQEFLKEYPNHQEVVKSIITMYQKSRFNKNDTADDFIIPFIHSGFIRGKDENKYIDIITNIKEKAQILYERNDKSLE